jgi:hypothetical protein
MTTAMSLACWQLPAVPVARWVNDHRAVTTLSAPLEMMQPVDEAAAISAPRTSFFIKNSSVRAIGETNAEQMRQTVIDRSPTI